MKQRFEEEEAYFKTYAIVKNFLQIYDIDNQETCTYIIKQNKNQGY